MYVRRFQNVVLRCPTPRFHCFLSSHWPSFRFLLFIAFLIPSIQFFFFLLRALFCFGIHINAILGNLPSAILWTWPYHVSSFCSICFIIAQLYMCQMSAGRRSSITHVPNVSRYRDPLVILVPNVSTPQLHMCHVSRYRDPLVILVPNASTPQLHMCHMSADTETP